MIKFKAINLCCGLMVCCVTGIHAQRGTVVSGGDATGTGGSVSYTVGQLDYINSTNGSATITEGIQQPYEIVIITGAQTTGISLSSSVYPNPTTDLITLAMQDADLQNAYYRLCD